MRRRQPAPDRIEPEQQLYRASGRATRLSFATTEAAFADDLRVTALDPRRDPTAQQHLASLQQSVVDAGGQWPYIELTLAVTRVAGRRKLLSQRGPELAQNSGDFLIGFASGSPVVIGELMPDGDLDASPLKPVDSAGNKLRFAGGSRTTQWRLNISQSSFTLRRSRTLDEMHADVIDLDAEIDDSLSRPSPVHRVTRAALSIIDRLRGTSNSLVTAPTRLPSTQSATL